MNPLKLLLWSATLLLAGSASASAVPTFRAEPAPEWTARFAGKAGWIGGDGVYSVALGGNRILWLFGDSLLGAVRDGRREGAVMVNNTLGVQTVEGKDPSIRFVSGKKREGKPSAVFAPADSKGWFWTQAAIRVGDRLFLFLPQIERSQEPGVFGFRHRAQWLAVVANPDDEPEKWRVKQHRLPFAAFGPDRERSWGSAVLEDGGQLYVYGYDEERGKGIGKKRLMVARVPAGKLDDFGTWQFRTADGWSAATGGRGPTGDRPGDRVLCEPVPGGKGYVMVYTENGLGDRIVGRFADSPTGPWSAPLLLYRCPEMGKDKGLFCYAAKAAPVGGRTG